MITIIGSVYKKIKELKLATLNTYWFFKKNSVKQAVLSNILETQPPKIVYEDGTQKSIIDINKFDIESFSSFIGSTGVKVTNVICNIEGQTVKTSITANIYEESTWKTLWQGTYNIYGWEGSFSGTEKRYIEVNNTQGDLVNTGASARYSIPVNDLTNYLGDNLFTQYGYGMKRKFRLTYSMQYPTTYYDLYGIYYNGQFDSSPQEGVEKTIIIDNLNYPNTDWSKVSKDNNALICAFVSFYNGTSPTSGYDWYDGSIQLGINNGFVDIRSWSDNSKSYPLDPYGFRLTKIEILD